MRESWRGGVRESWGGGVRESCRMGCERVMEEGV